MSAFNLPPGTTQKDLESPEAQCTECGWRMDEQNDDPAGYRCDSCYDDFLKQSLQEEPRP